MELITDSAFSFSVVGRGSFLRFVEALRPSASLTLLNRKKVRAVVVKNGKKARDSIEELMKRKNAIGRRVGVCMEGWSGVNKKHVECVTVKIGREVFIF